MVNSHIACVKYPHKVASGMRKNVNNIRKISIIPSNCRERYLKTSGSSARTLSERGINFAGISMGCPFQVHISDKLDSIVRIGRCQVRCRFFYAAFCLSSTPFFTDFPGLRCTISIGVQSRVFPDQRSGCFALAAS